MRQSIDEISGYPQKPTLAQRAIWVIWLLFLISICFAALVFALTMPARAVEINPSVDTQPIQCRYSITKWLCDTSKPGAQGAQGINGTPGLPGESNFTAIYYNATNFTARSNITYFINSTSFNVTSNYTVFNGSSFYNTTAINESYAYLPGRAGGQTLNGGTTSGNLILNGSMSNGDIILQPDGGNVGIGISPTTNLHIYKSSIPAIKYQSSLSNGATQQGRLVVKHTDDTQADVMVLQAASIVTSGFNRIYVGGGSSSYNAANVISFFVGSSPTTKTGIEYMRFYGPMLGIGAAAVQNPTANLTVSGNVRFSSYGAGTATFDSGGNITSVSDAKAKTNIVTYPAGLAQVLQLAPKQYKYSPDSGLDTQNTYVGFIAQDVEKVLPDAVKTKDDVKYEQKLLKKGATADEDEYTTVEVKTGTQTKSLDDRAIIAALVNAVKEQQTEIDALKARIEKLENPK